MPDISMCMSAECPNKSKCHRHALSGTKPNPYRQAYAKFEWEGGCEYYWPTRQEGTRQQPEDVQ